MFLISVNKVIDNKHYFQDVVPAISELWSKIGGVVVHQLILDADNNPIDYDPSVLSAEPVTRVVIAHFKNTSDFNKYWNSGERKEIWKRWAQFAAFSDTPVNDEAMQINFMPAPKAELVELTEKNILKLKILGLSPREAEVLYWVGKGKNNEDIARLLHVSVFTVKRHIANIFDKLGVNTRVGAVVLALEALSELDKPLQLIL